MPQRLETVLARLAIKQAQRQSYRRSVDAIFDR
jgi:hypothetical protein